MFKKITCLLALCLFLSPSLSYAEEESENTKSVGVAIGASAKPIVLQKPWAAYYADKVPLSSFDPYDLIVFDSQDHPQLKPLSDRGKTLLGYLSLGEIEKIRPYYRAVKSENLLLDENKNWPGSYFVDVRNKFWAKRVIEELIPQLLHKGFHGVFIDTLDNPIELERQDPEKFKGMRDASVTLIKAIRYHYPQIPIMVNRAFEILPELGEHITMVLGESMYSSYDFTNKKYQKVNENDYRDLVSKLQNFKKSFPKIRVMSLDYWNPEESEEIKKIYNIQRANGFEPFVSVLKLDHLTTEPK
ncbi:MAG: endo alpha-1,4 polygalactosaminidase [Alphaproteobacteria bacterium]|nr:endo alpha-1,4 polygalactosaminidase [Alphaproteobacteria bacterium]